MAKIKSDGGSSEYYAIKLPKGILKDNGDGTVTIQTGDVIRYALNDSFPLGNIFKALKRLGQKEGIDVDYDVNKIKYFLDDYVKAYYTGPAVKEGEDSEWIRANGRCPDLDNSTLVQCRFRSGRVSLPSDIKSFDWTDQGFPEDIMEYQIV